MKKLKYLIMIVAVVLVGCNYQIVPIPTAPVKPVEVAKSEPVLETLTCKTQFSGDYEVMRLRAMWAVCATAYTQRVPTAGPNLVAGICDCYVDKIRAGYAKAKLLKLTPPEAMKMGTIYIGECQAEMMDRLGRQQGSGQGTNFELPKSKYDI